MYNFEFFLSLRRFVIIQNNFIFIFIFHTLFVINIELLSEANRVRTSGRRICRTIRKFKCVMKAYIKIISIILILLLTKLSIFIDFHPKGNNLLHAHNSYLFFRNKLLLWRTTSDSSVRLFHLIYEYSCVYRFSNHIKYNCRFIDH